MASLAEIGERDLTDAFEAGRVPDGDFTHADHVRVAWELLRRYPLGLALDQVTLGIRALAEQRGLPDLYHATITTFYVLAIADRMAMHRMADDGETGAAEISTGEMEVFETFAARHPELLGPSRAFLGAHYSPETLDSERAKRDFVLPDRLPSSV